MSEIITPILLIVIPLVAFKVGVFFGRSRNNEALVREQELHEQEIAEIQQYVNQIFEELVQKSELKEKKEGEENNE